LADLVAKQEAEIAELRKERGGKRRPGKGQESKQ
jgi:hypothetical protein